MQTVKDILPDFIESLRAKRRSPATVLAYRADLEQLISYLAEKNKTLPEQVQASDIEAFRDSLLLQKYTPKSVSRKLNAVKTFFRWLETQKMIVLDPTTSVTHPKTESTLPKYLTQLQYRALRDVVRSDKRITAIVELILQTGLRISEVANLKIENIKDSEIIIEAYATQPERKIPMNKIIKETIQNYLSEVDPQSIFVFVSKNGKPLAIRNIRASVDRYIQKAEIGKYSVNDLRTTFIVENLKRGVDIVTISQVAGHKRLSTTERYLELLENNPLQTKDGNKKQDLEEL